VKSWGDTTLRCTTEKKISTWFNLERQPPEDPRAQHRLAGEHLPAAVPADIQQGEPGHLVVVQVPQQIDAVTGQALRLVHDKKSDRVTQQADQLRDQVEPAARARWSRAGQGLD
jgi:hypothetical protein